METWEKELVDMMKNSSETPDALLYRLIRQARGLRCNL